MKRKSEQPQTPTFEDVLYEFSRAKDVPDAALLNEFLARYPQHATALRKVAVQSVLDATKEAVAMRKGNPQWPSADQTSTLVSQAMRIFDERLKQIQAEKRNHSLASEIDDPFAHLNKHELREIGRQLNANTLFVTRLRDCLIDAQTISEGFLQRVAELLRIPRHVMAIYLAGAPKLAVGMSFKSEVKPETGHKQSFADAVRGSNLTAEQQRHLLEL